VSGISVVVIWFSCPLLATSVRLFVPPLSCFLRYTSPSDEPKQRPKQSTNPGLFGCHVSHFGDLLGVSFVTEDTIGLSKKSYTVRTTQSPRKPEDE